MSEALIDAAILQRVIADAIGAAKAAARRRPRAYLVAGPPGSGKSRLAEEAIDACRRDEGSPVHVDADRLRAYHPAYPGLARSDPAAAFAMSQPSASLWADTLRDAAVDRRLDVVIEGTFKTQANTGALLDQLLGAGYAVHLLVKIVPPCVSLLQIERRFERQMSGARQRENVPRRVSEAAQNIAAQAVIPLLDLFDRRGLTANVSLREASNQPIPVRTDASSAAACAGELGELVAAILRQGPTDAEKHFCYVALAEVQEMRDLRGAPANAESGSALEAAIAMMAKWG